MIYLDASVVVPIFITELTSPRLDAWLATDPEICLSEWTVSEFSSALSLRLRTGGLDVEERDAAELELDGWLADGILAVEVGEDDIRAARTLLRFDRNLRTPDALHLAIASRLDCRIATYDRRLAEAAVAIGMEVVVP